MPPSSRPKLSAYVAQKKRETFDRLRAGLEPAEGEFDGQRLKEAQATGEPQMGSSFLQPQEIRLEFLYPGTGAPIVFSVRLTPPERIVFLPVPEWVVESVWQGDVDGSYHFESDAREMVARFTDFLEPEPNAAQFAPTRAKRRE